MHALTIFGPNQSPGQDVPSSRKAPNHGGDSDELYKEAIGSSEASYLERALGVRGQLPVMDSRPASWTRWPTMIRETKMTLAMAPSVHT